MDNLSFEQKIAALLTARTPQERAEMVRKFSTNAEFFVRTNAAIIPLDQYMKLNREKFRPVAEKAAFIRSNIKNRGWTDRKYQKYLAELPPQLFDERPEFSAKLDRRVLKKNIDAFLRSYPMFRVDK